MKTRVTFAEVANPFTAMTEVQKNVEISADNTILTIHGIQVDIVTTAASPFRPVQNAQVGGERFDEANRGLQSWMAGCHTIAETLGPDYKHTSQLSTEAFWRTLVCNTLPNG